MTTRTSNVGLFNTGDVLTEAHLDSLPAGWLGYVEKTTDTTGVTTGQTIVSVTVTLNANRRIKISAYFPSWISTVNADRAQFQIAEGATQLTVGRSQTQLAGIATESPVHLANIETPSAGSHTYSATFGRQGGTGTLTLSGDPTAPTWILVEDMGPA